MATTTTSLALTDEDAVLLFVPLFDEQRVELAGLLEEGIFHLESVDVLTYELEGDTPVLRMSATSAFPSLLPGDLPSDGWDIMTVWKSYWESFVEDAEDDVAEVMLAVVPNIRVELSGHEFECPREFLFDMIELRASQADFVEICIP